MTMNDDDNDDEEDDDDDSRNLQALPARSPSEAELSTNSNPTSRQVPLRQNTKTKETNTNVTNTNYVVTLGDMIMAIKETSS